MTLIYSHTPNPQVSGAYYQALLDFLRLSVGHEALLASGIQCAQLPVGPMNVEEYLALVDVANDALGDDWGIDLGLGFRPATYGILGLLALHCDNLLEGLTMVLKFESLVHDLGVSQVTSQKDTLLFSWQAHVYQARQLRPVAQSVLSGMQQFSSWLCGQPIQIHNLILPCDCKHEWLNALNLDYQIEEGKLEFQINMGELKKSIPQADVELKNALLNSAQLMLLKKQPIFIKNLLIWLDERLKDSEYSLEDAAQFLDMSPRTLQRHLQQHGLTYQLLVVNFRKNKSMELLKNSHMSISQIAAALGFHEQSSFSNAFKNWLGRSPMSVVKELRTKKVRVKE